MSIGDIVALVGVCAVALGLILTWVRNGKQQSKRDGALETQLKGVEKRLDDDHTGLGAIKSSVDSQAVTCARISSGFEERIKNLEKKRKR